MDAVAGFLDGPRAQRAFLLRSILEPPWALRIEDRAPMTVVAVVAGDAWIVPDRGAAEAMSAGDVALVRGPDPYLVADRPDAEPRVLIGPEQVCTTLAGEPLAEYGDLGVRTWGNRPDGSTTLLTGTYVTDGQVSRRLVDALPPVVVHCENRAGGHQASLIPLLADEITRDEPGQSVMLDRLLDMVLVDVVRSWIAAAHSAPPTRIAAYGDPIVGPALRRLEGDLAHPWTVASLAASVSVSRATLARRFRDLVGESPMAYLANLRLATAADLLTMPEMTVTEASARVGYHSPYTFSTAFKRRYGWSPREHRANAAA
jgi:AraC-like DNA-binding protein